MFGFVSTLPKKDLTKSTFFWICPLRYLSYATQVQTCRGGECPKERDEQTVKKWRNSEGPFFRSAVQLFWVKKKGSRLSSWLPLAIVDYYFQSKVVVQ